MFAPKQIRSGLVRGFACPISDTRFVTTSEDRAELETQRQAQDAHTAAVVDAIDQKFPVELGRNRDVETYRTLLTLISEGQ